MRKKENFHGIAMAIVLIVLFVATVLGTLGLGGRGIASMASASRARMESGAFYAAESGNSRAVYAIKQNDSALPSACTCSTSPSCSGTSCTNTPTFFGGTTLLDGATFTLQITNNGSSSTYPVTAPDGTLIPPSMMYIKSIGTFNGYMKFVFNLVQVSSSGGWQWQYAEFGASSVSMSGQAYTDSYNSNTGAYGGSNANLGNGNVGTNSNVNSAISLSGQADVKGNAAVGPGGHAGSPTISSSGQAGYNSASVLGSQLNLPANTDPYCPSNPSGCPAGGSNNYSHGNTILTPGQYGNVQVSGQGSITLQCNATSPSNFSFTGVQLSGQAQLIVDSSCSKSNPISMVVYNTLQLTGQGVVNSGDVSTRLLIYGMPSLASAQVSGQGTAAYALYAPNAAIQVSGQGDIFGSLVGASVQDSGQANIHYDQALNNDQYIPGGATTVTSESWLSK